MARLAFSGRRQASLFAFLTLILAPGLAAAEGPCDGVLSGQSLEPLPAGAAFDVEI